MTAVRAPSLCDYRVGHAPPVHFDVEPFHVAADGPLSACPLSRPGICMNPCCSRPFAPVRDWQRYCGADCRKADEAGNAAHRAQGRARAAGVADGQI